MYDVGDQIIKPKKTYMNKTILLVSQKVYK